MPRKNVEDQLAAIDDGARQARFDISCLRWREVMVEEYETRASGCHDGNNFIQLSATHKSSRIRPRATLNQDCGFFRSRRPRQFLKLRQGRIEIHLRDFPVSPFWLVPILFKAVVH